MQHCLELIHNIDTSIKLHEEGEKMLIPIRGRASEGWTHKRACDGMRERGKSREKGEGRWVDTPQLIHYCIAHN